ncbi:hypothetical protein PENSPDRAFT_298581 [Peniophora sp. CONT]|nr:hypothetical protein PENSPDRAFT_298581 [Peniophora sp. CONT]
MTAVLALGAHETSQYPRLHLIFLFSSRPPLFLTASFPDPYCCRRPQPLLLFNCAMPETNTSKRPREDDALVDHPNKKPASNKLGRPMNVGEEQYEHMMKGLSAYAVEKRKKLEKKPHNISKVYDDNTFSFIAKFGWDNPFRATKKKVGDTTDAARAAAEAEAKAAAKVVAKGPAGMDQEKFEEQKRKDAVVKAVRKVSVSYA